MMRPVRALAVLGLAFFLAGCEAQPISQENLHAYGVKGQVVDQETGVPIADATLTDVHGGPTFKVDTTGHFVVAPIYGWHGVQSAGVLSYSVFPNLDQIAPLRFMHVEAPGYQPQIFEIAPTWFQSQTLAEGTNKATPVGAQVSDDFLVVDTVKLTPSAAGAGKP